MEESKPARDAPDGPPFPRQASARAVPTHGGTSNDMDCRQVRKPTTGDCPRGGRGKRGTVPEAGEESGGLSPERLGKWGTVPETDEESEGLSPKRSNQYPMGIEVALVV